jgi:hypothetical protein
MVSDCHDRVSTEADPWIRIAADIRRLAEDAGADIRDSLLDIAAEYDRAAQRAMRRPAVGTTSSERH